MRVLVTGMTSRACNENKNSRDVMISWMIAEICRSLGYEVEHRNPGIDESYEEFDHVFVGLAPLHGLGSNRAYAAMAAILRTYWEKKLSFYLDDIALRNTVNGIRTMTTNPERFFKGFYVYRLDYARATQPEYKKWLQSGVEMLNKHEWPTTLVPAYPWANLDELTKSAPNMTHKVGIDYTAWLPDYTDLVKDDRVVHERWVTDTRDDAWIARQRVGMPILRYVKGYERRPVDAGLVIEYSRSWGVLDRGYDHGWWTYRMGYARQAETLYSTKWQNVEQLGDAYTALPESIELMTRDERAELVRDQGLALEKAIESRDVARDRIRALVEGKA
jgi:hypothetical protein